MYHIFLKSLGNTKVQSSLISLYNREYLLTWVYCSVVGWDETFFMKNQSLHFRFCFIALDNMGMVISMLFDLFEVFRQGINHIYLLPETFMVNFGQIRMITKIPSVRHKK